jgi:hypothetical protein
MRILEDVVMFFHLWVITLIDISEAIVVYRIIIVVLPTHLYPDSRYCQDTWHECMHSELYAVA